MWGTAIWQLSCLVVLSASALTALPSERTAPVLSNKPTFSCERARTSIARIICLAPGGAAADWDLAAAKWARRFLLDEGSRDAFAMAHVQWVESLYDACGLRRGQAEWLPQQATCILRAFRGRAHSYRSELSDDALVEAQLSPEERAQLQIGLINRGFLSDGEADGEFGPLTRDAIRKFQEASGFPQSEFLSAHQRSALLGVGPSATRSTAPMGGPFVPVPPTPAPAAPPPIANLPASPPVRELDESARTISVPMQKQGGVYAVPVLINGALTLDFVVDSGASDVSIPADVVLTLIRTGTLQGSDFLGERTYVLADGRKVPSKMFRIRSLRVGNKTIENVLGSVAPMSGHLLLGQSFLGRFRSWSVDNDRNALVLE